MGKKLLGILHLSSRIIQTTGKQGIIMKRFTPFDGSGTIYARTKKISEMIDQYAIIEQLPTDEWVICQYVGIVGDPIIESLIIKMIGTVHWSNKVERSLENYISIDLTPNRKDFTSLPIFSIDPDNCKDIDDAIHCIERDGKIEVGVHIADVSSFIPEGSELDLELSKRCESIYLHDVTLHMMPVLLSTELCSLNENTIKRAYSIIVTFSKTDTFDDMTIEFTKSWIKVGKNYTYETFPIDNMIYTTGQHLMSLFCNKNNSYDTHKMVEVYMILANYFVAKRLRKYNTGILRKHTIESKDTINNNDMQLVHLHHVAKMNRADYILTDNISGHDGLNLDAYTHFTSPIRRYADIIVHRSLYKCDMPINNTNITQTTVDSLNYYHKLYDDVMMIDEVKTKLFSNCTDIITDGVVIYIDNTILFIRLMSYNLTVRINCISDKFRNIVNINSTETELSIISQYNNVKIKLFDRVKIHLYYLVKTIKKLIGCVIEPNMMDLFILNDFLPI